MTNNTYSLFHRNGEYDGNVSGPFQFVIAPTLAAWDGYHYEGEYDNTYYYHDGEPIKRPESPVSLEGLTLKGVPAKSTVVIDSDIYEVDTAQDVTLSFNQGGTYVVRVIPPFPYLDKEFTIDYQP